MSSTCPQELDPCNHNSNPGAVSNDITSQLGPVFPETSFEGDFTIPYSNSTNFTASEKLSPGTGFWNNTIDNGVGSFLPDEPVFTTPPSNATHFSLTRDIADQVPLFSLNNDGTGLCNTAEPVIPYPIIDVNFPAWQFNSTPQSNGNNFILSANDPTNEDLFNHDERIFGTCNSVADARLGISDGQISNQSGFPMELPELSDFSVNRDVDDWSNNYPIYPTGVSFNDSNFDLDLGCDDSNIFVSQPSIAAGNAVFPTHASASIGQHLPMVPASSSGRVIPVAPADPTAISRNRVSCTFIGCSKTFGRNADLLRHMKIHWGTRDHSCPQMGCNKQFLRKDKMRDHARRVHHLPM